VGAFGVVRAAYDPELDRKVAIKLLRPDVRQGMEARDEQIRRLGDESEARTLRDAHARLLREAQAMARLSHPNVIVVHEVGSVDDGVFVAMEFIDGVTLGRWIEDRSHGWREVLRVFLEAGAGLAAAHRAGLVHRDFKPDNVLLGSEGQVRVLDFGLARASDDQALATARPPAEARDPLDLDPLGTPLTRTGAVMGTPAYMSPEQYLGHPADARSDQFSFCVALYEGLYGVRPFAGDTLATLSTHVVEGRVRETPAEARVPKRVLAVLRRGLAPQPADRFPSMEALLAALRHDPARRWRWGGLVLGVGALTSVITVAATGGDDAADACADQQRRLDGVWDDQARAAVIETIEGTGLDYAPRVAATTVKLLDDYTGQWVHMAADACGAALVAQGDDTEHRRRAQCLDQRLAEVGALVDALREPDTGMAEVAVKATASLTTGLSACADPRRLAAYDVTDDPQLRQRLAEAHAKLALAKAQGVLGHYARAVELASEVVQEAHAAGAGPLEALGLLTRGTYRERTDDPEQSEADLRAAVDLADRHGDPGTRAQALIMLVYVVAQDRTRYVEARMLGDQARAVLEYIDADPLLLADLDNNLGVAARIDGDFDGALELHLRSHERRVQVLGQDHPAIGRSLLNIGISMGGSPEHLPQAEQYLRQALTSLERSLGPQHPVVGSALTNLGNCLARQGRLDEALVLQQRAFEVLEYGGVMINDVPTFRVDNFPYGGTKASGLGREGVRFAMEELTEPKVLVARGLGL
ncbi:MAG: aldehyde dehydrogenase family protein, partial [Myxococcales bacterium]|nr:aldehyde dehydrogenase family protein [Myxococcales bacterium]